MSSPRKVAVLALCSLLFAAPVVHAQAKADKECVIDAVASATLADANVAFILLLEYGYIPRSDILSDESLRIRTDAGYFTSGFVVFHLPEFKDPVIFGKLRIQLDFAHVFWPVSIALNDIGDEAFLASLLAQETWTEAEYSALSDDIWGGRAYGDFSVEPSPADDGRVFEVPLSYEAMYDLNAAAGDVLTIGVSALSPLEWDGEGEHVKFRTPDEGGIFQLVLPDCRIR